jgi:hypothetical protein
MSEKINSGQEQTDGEKFEKLINEINKKMNLKFFRDKYTEVYESEILINSWIYINMNKKNEIYSQNVKSFKLVHNLTEENDFCFKLIFESGFSLISISIIETLKILNSTLNINVEVNK